jgi:hypothetical protein
MTERELLALIAAYERASMGSSTAAGATISTTVFPSSQTMTTLEIDRYNALNMYFGRPLGNEVENRSQIVLPELRDTIEWIMPQLMRMFVASKTICRFEAETQEDEQQAEMETAVVNHVFMKMNNGFFVLHDFFKDALLMRNGYASVYFKDEEHTSVERYSGLTELELQKLLADMADEDTEILEQREYESDVPILAPVPNAIPDPSLPTLKMNVWDIKIRRTEKKGRCCVTCLPPEEVYVSPRARESLDGIPFAMHKTETPRSELVADGHPRDVVDEISTGRPEWLEMDALARNTVTDQLSVENPADKAMQTIEVRNITLRVDYDGDGIAELRHVLVAGDKILENEEIEEGPLASCAPIRMPHRHTGLSYYDLIADLQVIKTTLFRQGLDNLYLANNLRVGVDWKNCSVDDLLSSRPGGVIRTNGPPSNVLMPFQQESNLVSQVLPAMEYIDQIRAGRTGVGDHTMGVDADELQNVTKGGQLAAMSAASLKIELVARLLAEGVKEIFTKIHGVLMRHQDGPMQFELSGKWVQADPSSWRRRTKIHVNVGLGSGNREELRANIILLSQAQQAVAQIGLVGPKQAYATFKVMSEALGFNQPEQFAMDPSSPEYQQHLAQMAQMPHPPDPHVTVAQIHQQTEVQKQQSSDQREIIKLQAALAKAQAEAQAAQQKAAAEMEHAALSTHNDRQMAVMDQQNQMNMTIVKALASIEAQQLKNSQERAGQVLEQDFEIASQGIEHGHEAGMAGMANQQEASMQENDHAQQTGLAAAANGSTPKSKPKNGKGTNKDAQMLEVMQSLQQTLEGMRKPKTATLSDGRQIRIE